MSEYQYYDFRALDRPLTRNEMATLRSISTRAAITATSFTNHISAALMRLLLEFVTSPERPIIQVAPWLGLLQKLSREKNPVVSLEP